MNAAHWIARRFSFARKRFRVINIISSISLIGIVLGVTTLLVAMSVLNGFQKLAYDLFTTIDAPVRLIRSDGSALADPEELLKGLRALSGITSAEPFLEGEAILDTGVKSELVMLKGLDDTARNRIAAHTRGNQSLFGSGTIAVGEVLAYRNHLYRSQRIHLFSSDLISLGLESLEQPYLLPMPSIPVTTIQSFFSIQKQFDDHYVLTSNKDARSILLYGENSCTGIELRSNGDLSEHELAKTVKHWLENQQQQNIYRIETIDEKYSHIFLVMLLEKWASFAVLMLVVLVAALSLTGSLSMTVIEKHRELFFLRCLGLEKQDFRMIFILQGAATGIIGSIFGMLFAWIICFLQQAYQLVRLPANGAFIINAYPVSMQVPDFVVVGISTLLLCTVISLYPARKAALIAASTSLDLKTD